MKSDSESRVITFDLMQNLPVPTLTQFCFTQRQLRVYNFGIHDCRDDTAVRCMWSEIADGRGTNEWNWQILRGRLKEVNHKFLVMDHTYPLHDRDFSHIEKKEELGCCLFTHGLGCHS